MGASPTVTSYSQLESELNSRDAPLLIDVRRETVYLQAADRARCALRRDPEAVADWAQALPPSARIVVYCVHGGDVSRAVASELGRRGFHARYLEGGFEQGWKVAGGALESKPIGASSRWVTRERPKVDRIACPWLVRRFLDPSAEFAFVPADRVRESAAATCAVPYDVPDVELSHVGERCSFDAFLAKYHLQDPALHRLARIVRGADTNALHLAPEAAGLLAVSIGLSATIDDDLEMLDVGMRVYDALLAWSRQEVPERHAWQPTA